MSVRPIIDAGPALNFFSINKERLLFSVLGQISTPETVAREVLRKATSDPRFQAAEKVWRKVTPRWVAVLPDDVTPELSAVVNRISGLPMAERKQQAKDLGEIMVIAHAVVAAEAGQAVVVLIDDGSGARLATQEINRLRRLRTQGKPAGTIALAGTLTILKRAAGKEHLPDKPSMRSVYDRLRRCDDGLPSHRQHGPSVTRHLDVSLPDVCRRCSRYRCCYRTTLETSPWTEQRADQAVGVTWTTIRRRHPAQ